MNKCSRFLVIFALVLLSVFTAFAQEAPELRGLDDIIQSAITANQIPGAVVLIGHNGKVVYKKAYGSKSLEPVRQKMSEDTIFDMASLTKCMSTATAVMQLEEQGKIRLNDPVSKYIPDFGKNGKEQITIRQLVTHFSGLREDLDL
jgi:CubicO group peptidase (beta-lactamase class C family)